ncbi:hypothetical protein [Streptomyces sp. NPDC058330]|uniref:hypothetical protein n=1 Tax=Streptomyces sp. NPDC058330 TaxID=3346449 RepID=UPI0036E75028
MTHDTERTDLSATETSRPAPGSRRGTPTARPATGTEPVAPQEAAPEMRRTTAPGTTARGDVADRDAATVPGVDDDGRGAPSASRTGPATPADRPAAPPAGTAAPDRHADAAAPSPEDRTGTHGHDAAGDRPLMPAHERDALSLRMRQAVSDFVENPRQAVEEADSAFDSIVADLTEALDERRRTLRASWQGEGAEARTEELRVALQHYRDAGEQLLRI